MFKQVRQKKLFELEVTDIFNFQDGRTLFSGKLVEEIKTVPKCRATILIDRKVFKIISIEGVWRPAGKEIENPLLRTVSTTEEINKSELPYEQGRVILTGYV